MSYDREITILASLLWRPHLTATVLHHIPVYLWSSEFAFQDHAVRQLADCIIDCWNKRRETTPANVIEEARLRQYRGVDETIRNIMARTPGESEATLDRTAQDLAAEIRKIRLQYIVGKATMMLTADDEPEKTIGEVMTMINTEAGTGLNIVEAPEGTSEMRESYKARKSGAGQALGVPTGFHKIDRIVGGIPTGAVTILGARPSQGKTAIAGCIALHAAKQGFPVIFFSHEMQANAIYQRMLCVEGNLSYTHVRTGRLSPKGEGKFAAALETMKKLHIAVIDTGDPHPADCRTAAMYLLNKWQNPKPPLIVVDYVQLESLHNVKPEFRTQELAKISRYWCETAKLTNGGVLLLSQLNREATGMPNMSQLRDCGGLEQDATAIMLLWRPSKERPQDQGEDVDGTNRKKAGFNWGVLAVAKSRNSDLCEQELHFSGYNMTFRDWDKMRDLHLAKSAMMQAELNAMLADIIQNQNQNQQYAPARPVDDADIPNQF